MYSRPAARLSNLFAIDRQTGEETVLAPGQSGNVQCMWLPGTDTILFQSDRNGKNGIWIFRFKSGFATGAPVLIRHDVAEADWKGIGRDGTLFYAERRPGSFIYQATIDPQTMRIEGAPTQVRDARPGKAHRPSWSPRGDLWAYLVTRDERQNSTYAMVIRQPDGKEVEVPHTAEPRTLPRWCEADGGTFVYPYSQAFLERFDARTGAAVPPGPDLLKLKPQDSVWGYTFAPDCKSVYLTHSPTGTRNFIVRHDIATGKETELLNSTDTDHASQLPYVSPDGRWLAFLGHVPGKGMCLLVRPTGGGPLRIVGEVGFGEADLAGANPWSGSAVWRGISWTPDSRRVLYVRRATPSTAELYWAPIDGGSPQPLGISMPGATAPSVHPDGKRILFSAEDDTEDLRVLRNLPLK